MSSSWPFPIVNVNLESAEFLFACSISTAAGSYNMSAWIH